MLLALPQACRWQPEWALGWKIRVAFRAMARSGHFAPVRQAEARLALYARLVLIALAPMKEALPGLMARLLIKAH